MVENCRACALFIYIWSGIINQKQKLLNILFFSGVHSDACDANLYLLY